ncbi:SusD family protein [compost metagenome]
MAFEAMRKRDLVRWGDYYRVMKQIALDFVPLGSRAFGGKAGENTSERDVLWPIPDAETTVNKAIGQNPGW